MDWMDCLPSIPWLDFGCWHFCISFVGWAWLVPIVWLGLFGDSFLVGDCDELGCVDGRRLGVFTGGGSLFAVGF